MRTETMLIREIQPQDNPIVESIIKAAFPEFGLPLVGTAYEDKETAEMFESFQGERAMYYVIEEEGVVVGGGGIKQLANTKDNVCELQKMYFLPSARGKGYGRTLFEKCLKAAKELGYEQCYLESASQLKAAIHIYEGYDFEHLEGPIGGTGHYSCGVWMIKNL